MKLKHYLNFKSNCNNTDRKHILTKHSQKINLSRLYEKYTCTVHSTSRDYKEAADGNHYHSIDR